jgi:predicted Zn-dependent peptidase
MLMDGWLIPPSRDPDHYALEIAGMLLSDGESSRLYKSLVRDRAIAVDVQAEANGFRGPDWFELTTKLASGAKIDAVSKQLDAELAAVAQNGPTDTEMAKLRARVSAHFLLGLQSNFARAEKLAEFELYWGDATLLNDELKRYLAVTKEDVRRVVAKYLTKARRTRVEVHPAAEKK